MYHNSSVKAGIPYDDIIWYDVAGQPFGTASDFNAIILGDANNIVDTKGAMAVGGDFASQRGLSLGYGNDGKLTGTGYSPDRVRFLVGGNVAMQGPLVVIGHVVGGGRFFAAKGSTYMIGKDGTAEQSQELSDLYYANGGSRYWRPSDRETHYAVSSYDTPRYIPAQRINADTAKFFEDARSSISNFFDCIVELEANGTVTEHYHEWILGGSDPDQNVFLIDVRPNGILDKEIRFEIPQGSLGIVIFRTGDNAHLQYGLWGEEDRANNTLYVFEDAGNIFMEVPAAVWGSILAPDAVFHAHKTGGTVSGNAALGSLQVNNTSGFEFHLYPFVGGVRCDEIETPPQSMQGNDQTDPEQIEEPRPACPACPEPEPCPVRPSCPEAEPCPKCQPCPGCPACPEAEPCPGCPVCPEAEPCPACPVCPEAAEPCPTCPVCPEAAEPCPTCPDYPKPEPCPTCPECPSCPESLSRIEIAPIPIPIPYQVEKECAKCLVQPGVIFGCIWGCKCCCNHEWEVKLYRSCGERIKLIHRIVINSCGCFEFKVAYDDFYQLEICPIGTVKGKGNCKPMLTLKNVGVANLVII